MTTFYLIRHGQTDWNIENKLQGQIDIPLNETGIMQINALADRLAEKHLRIDLIVTSPLIRAVQSARIIAEKTGYEKEIVTDPGFIERSFGLLEGAIWVPGLNFDDPKYQVEPADQLRARAKEALDRYLDCGDLHVLVVSHGAMLAAVRHVLSEGKIDFKDHSNPITNGRIICCEVHDDGSRHFYDL